MLRNFPVLVPVRLNDETFPFVLLPNSQYVPLFPSLALGDVLSGMNSPEAFCVEEDFQDHIRNKIYMTLQCILHFAVPLIAAGILPDGG